MDIGIFQVDAFTGQLFAGNPAAVCLLEDWPEDSLLQNIAAENNLAETAYVIDRGDRFLLRWFTPVNEVPLCGHATLASAFVLRRLGHGGELRFESKSGLLRVDDGEEGRLRLDFPAFALQASPVTAAAVAQALGEMPAEVHGCDGTLMAVFADGRQVRELRPDMAAVAGLAPFGVIATAPGEDGYDCISRFFAPNEGIPEDPVTGFAHCILLPYWAERLGRQRLLARQASPRGGEILGEIGSGRVYLQGHAVLYMEGMIRLP